MNSPDDLQGDFERFPFIARIGTELINCRRECREKTMRIEFLEQKLRITETKLKFVQETAETKFCAWEKLMKERWKQQSNGDTEMLAQYEKAFEEQFAATLKNLGETTFKSQSKREVDVGVQTGENEADEDEIEIISVKKASPASNDSGMCSSDDVSPVVQRPSQQTTPQVGTSGIAPLRQVQHVVEPLQVLRTQQGQPVAYIQGVPTQYLIPQSNNVYYALQQQPTYYIQQSPMIPQPLVAVPRQAALSQSRRIRKRPISSNGKITAEEADPEVPEIPCAPSVLNCQSVHPTTASLPVSNSSCSVPQIESHIQSANSTAVVSSEAIVREAESPKRSRHEETTANQLQKLQPSPAASKLSNQPEMSAAESTPSVVAAPIQQTETPQTNIRQPSDAAVTVNQNEKNYNFNGSANTSTSSSPSLSSSHALTSTRRVQLRKRIPYRFTEDNSDRVEVYAYSKPTSTLKPTPVIPNWNHYRAKHVCRLSISSTEECGLVVNGKIRELTVHIDYDMRKHTTPINLCLYYYMRSHLQYPGCAAKFLKYQKETSPKIRKYHVRFLLPASCPFGDVFYVTGHIGTSTEAHDMGELPSECIALPIDVKRPS